MKSRRRSFLSMLDDSVRWTGMPDRVVAQMAGAPYREHRPSRWAPMLPIAWSCVLLITSLVWPSVLDAISSGFIISVMTVFWCVGFGMMSGIHSNGPLGKSSLEDDERESALRKESLLVCLGLLAALNCLGQPLILVLSHWQDWQFSRIACVVTSGVMLNFTLLGCLPTLYASWRLGQLPSE